jgi:cytidylate kinase
VILEGRDIGTEVFPDAELKFFLDAGQGSARAEGSTNRGRGLTSRA